jgi:hypothetical protein
MIDNNKIYFIQCKGFIKIGYTSRDISQRFSQIQSHCPYELKIIFIYEGDLYTEELLHRRFNHLNVRGEWFLFNKEIKDFIKNQKKIISNYKDETIIIRDIANKIRNKQNDENNIFNIIKQSGCIRKSEITRKTQHLTIGRRDEVLQKLIDSDRIIQIIKGDGNLQTFFYELKYE